MQLESSLYTILGSIFSEAPLLICFFVGICVGIFKYRKSKTPSLFAIIGCSVMLLTTVISPLRILLTQYFVMNGMNVQSIGYFSLGVNLVFSLLFAVGIGLILAAVWKDRKQNQ